MVQLMTPRKVAVKFDVDESSEDSWLASVHKRPKLDPSSPLEQQWGSGGGGGATCAVSPPLAYDPLEEPSPLGLQLRKSPSLLDLIQMKLTQQKAVKLANKKNHKGAAAAAAASGGGTDKLKAMNFPASLLRIGTWEYKSKHEGDLVAKCYFAKHKLVWEVLDGSLKNKMEIQWSDVVAIKANYPDEGQATLDVVLARPPLFFRETNPQPRKHTLWQATTDFTGGQASINRRHFLQCPHGLLFGKHFEKLIQCDPRLNFLSQQPEIVLESPFFEARVSGTSDADEYRHQFSSKLEDGPIFGLQGSASPSGTHSSSSRNEDFAGRAPENYSREISSSSSVMDTPAIAEKGNFGAGISKMPSKFDQIKVPGLRSSMSVSDFVSHIGHCITEKMSGTPMYAGKEQPSSDILEEITQYLFNDSQLSLPSDEQSLMSRVNSLCCLLQKDPTTVQNLHARSDDGRMGETNSASASGYQSRIGEGFATPKIEVTDISDKQPGIPRRDSFGELLLNIPRIASLPQFLFNFS
ncbi:uncharacterized protein LOC133724974 [Rosa rugosa]|uniref:uncharacterized protein LOC133724974 n=1 Tax=Rosa rugosa TaxID=74645 RepID=UPI002B41138A|nr:uncharacterized protein LOC133724974 [Rosa rugosa]